MGYAFTKNLEVIQLPAGRVRQPRFPHLAPKPHPSRQWLRIRFSTSGSMPEGVRRRDRGQRPTATKDPNTKKRRRRRRRHCSRVRWPRFPQLAFGPHPSRQWLRIRFFTSGPPPKRRSAPRPGSAAHGYKKSEYETTTQVSSLPDELIAFIFKNWQPFYQLVLTHPRITGIQSRRDQLCRTHHPPDGRKPWSRQRMGRTAAGATGFGDPAACFQNP